MARDRGELKEFLKRSKLIDMKLQGRKFTWYRNYGTCKSRLDKALINEKLEENWQATSLRGLPRSILDHCAIILKTKEEDWCPKPFRFINAWTTHPKFREVVENLWKADGIIGWGSFVFKEKLKRLKMELKIWNSQHFGSIDQKISALRDELKVLDLRDNAVRLTEAELIARYEVLAKLLRQFINRISLLTQKAKFRWLKDGDVNIKLFH